MQLEKKMVPTHVASTFDRLLVVSEACKWGSRHIVISEGRPLVLDPAIRDFVLMCTETKGRAFSHGRTGGRFFFSREVLEQEGCRWRKFERLVECEDGSRELYCTYRCAWMDGWCCGRE